nr:MAG TPA: hypothetical protein [Caudoviricetes sp.]
MKLKKSDTPLHSVKLMSTKGTGREPSKNV